MRHIKTFKQNSDHRNCSSIVFIIGVYFQPWRLCSAPRRKIPDCCLSRCNGRAFYLQRETFSSRCWKPAQEESLFASHRHKEPCCQSHSESSTLALSILLLLNKMSLSASFLSWQLPPDRRHGNKKPPRAEVSGELPVLPSVLHPDTNRVTRSRRV